MRELSSTLQTASGLTLSRLAFLPDSTVPSAALVLVHGLGDHTERYRHHLNRLVDSGIAIFGCDFPGHGRSGGKRGHFSSFEQLHGVIRETAADASAQLPPGTPVGVFGHSMGGLVTLDLLLSGNHPFSFAWINSSLIDPSWNRPAILPHLIRLLHNVLPSFTFPSGVKPSQCYSEGNDSIPPGELPHRRISIRVANEMLRARDRITRNTGSFPEDFPILFTHGTDDAICPIDLARLVYHEMPGAGSTKAFKEFNGVLHEPWRYDRVLDEVAVWIGKVTETTAPLTA